MQNLRLQRANLQQRCDAVAQERIGTDPKPLRRQSFVMCGYRERNSAKIACVSVVALLTVCAQVKPFFMACRRRHVGPGVTDAPLGVGMRIRPARLGNALPEPAACWPQSAFGSKPHGRKLQGLPESERFRRVPFLAKRQPEPSAKTAPLTAIVALRRDLIRFRSLQTACRQSRDLSISVPSISLTGAPYRFPYPELAWDRVGRPRRSRLFCPVPSVYLTARAEFGPVAYSLAWSAPYLCWPLPSKRRIGSDLDIQIRAGSASTIFAASSPRGA